MNQFLAFVDVATFLLRMIVVGYAAGYLVRAWQTGSLFAGWVSNIENGILQEQATLNFGQNRVIYWFAEKLEDLLLCPLCLSPYVCGLLWALLLSPKLLPSPITQGISDTAWLICVVFASAQIAYTLRRDH